MYSLEKTAIEMYVSARVAHFQGMNVTDAVREIKENVKVINSEAHDTTIRMWTEKICASRGIQLVKRKYEPKSKLSAAEVKAQALAELEGCIMHQKDELTSFVRQYSDVSGKSRGDVYSMFKITLN